MTAKTLFTAGALALGGLAAAQAAPEATGQTKGPVGDPTRTAMTLYSQGMAVVQTQRSLTLEQGTQTVRWPVAALPETSSLALVGDGLRLTGFDVAASAGRGLATRIGQRVTLGAGDEGQTRREATLVALEGDAALVRVDGRIERIALSSPMVIGWPAAEDDARRAVSLDIAAQTGGQQTAALLYQRAAPAWQASYTGTFDAKTGALRVNASAIIDNQSDSPLDADQAWLVAGQPQRAGGNAPQPVMMMASKSRAAGDAQPGAPEATGGLYRYPLKNGLHIAAGATRGMTLMAPFTLDATRRTTFTHYATAAGRGAREHATLALHANNSTNKPLPAGLIRIYDADARAQLLGGDTLDDVPAGAPIDLTLGEAFDITGTREVAATETTGERRVRMTLSNATEKSRQVRIVERLPDNARLAQDTPKTSGRTDGEPTWQVTIPAGGQTDFSYRFVIDSDG